jgi:hypothetical protein
VTTHVRMVWLNRQFGKNVGEKVVWRTVDRKRKRKNSLGRGLYDLVDVSKKVELYSNVE